MQRIIRSVDVVNAAVSETTVQHLSHSWVLGRTDLPRGLERRARVLGVCLPPLSKQTTSTANLRTNLMDVRGFDSSRILILRGGSVMSIGNFPELLSQAILAGIILYSREVWRATPIAKARSWAGPTCSGSWRARWATSAPTAWRRSPRGAWEPERPP